jgi:hypothetical protein
MIGNNRQLKNFIGFATLVCALVIPLTAGASSEVILSGKFEGRSGHAVSGGVSVMKTDSGFLVVLEKDFSLDDAPDPKLGFGKNGYDASSLFSVLMAKNGAQIYALPANIEPASYNEFWVWCEKHNVPLGVAKLY